MPPALRVRKQGPSPSLDATHWRPFATLRQRRTSVGNMILFFSIKDVRCFFADVCLVFQVF